MFEACLRPVQDLLKTCSRLVQDLLKTCSKPVQGLLKSLFKATCSEDEERNIIQNAWLAILDGQGDNWICEIRTANCMHKLNLCQLDPDTDPDTWFFEFNTECVAPCTIISVSAA